MGPLGILEIIVGVLVLIVSVAIIAVVLFQSGSRSGINGAISGVADTFLSRDKAKTAEAKASKLTVILAVVFFVLVLTALVIAYFA